jgi:hypothetical protein
MSGRDIWQALGWWALGAAIGGILLVAGMAVG